KIAGYSEGRRWRLPVHRSEDDRENSRYRWRLANVEGRVEVHPSIADFRNDVNASLTFRNVERTQIEIPEAIGQRLQLLRVLDERLHLLLTSHRAEQLQHSVDGRRNARAGGSALHG